LLITLGMIAVVLGTTAIVYAEVLRLRGTQERYGRRADAADFLLRRVESDVRPGRAFLKSDGAFSSGDDTLVLSRGQAVIVYHRTGSRVERIERTGGKLDHQVVFDSSGAQVHFALEGDPATARTVVTTVEWDESPKIGISHPTVSLRTALRNR
jgi:hypothetical protein